MSVCLRPVIEQWGESYTYSIPHEDLINLIHELAARADAGDMRVDEYGDKTAVAITNGRKFLEFLSGGRAAVLAAKPEAKDTHDLTDAELAEVDQMAEMVPAWRASLDTEDGWLRFYVD